MSSGIVSELEATLAAMAAGKAPGVSGSKIAGITALCLQNVQSESVLIQKIYTHFKKTPGTHKLGVLYVVDSVTRKWLDHAKAQGQHISNGAIDGTYAAGVNRVTGLMPGLMSDMISTAPLDQKEKIEKLIGIWDRVQLFAPDMLEAFRHKLSNMNNNPSQQARSTTPNGTPPRDGGLPGHALNPAAPQAAPAPPTGAADIIKALAKIAHQPPAPIAAPTAAPIVAAPAASLAPQATVASPIVSNSQHGLSQILGRLTTSISQNGQNGQQGQHGRTGQTDGHSHGQGHGHSYGYQQPPVPQPMNPVQPSPAGYAATNAPLAGNMPPVAGSYMSQPLVPAAPPGGYMNPQMGAHGVAANTPAAAVLPSEMRMDPEMQQKVLIIKALMEQGIPGDKIPAILASLPGIVGPGPAAGALQPQAPQYGASSGYSGQYESRDNNRDRSRHDSVRSPPTSHRQRARSRSRSPSRNWSGHDSTFSPRTRDNSGRFGEFGDHHSPHERRHDDGVRDYRQRSPHRRMRSPSPIGHSSSTGVGMYNPMDVPSPEQLPKYVDYDANLGSNKIKVLSRTLFVGGVSCSEADLKQVFSQFGYVQSCIVNQEKRHAFVKMVTRKDAVAAKAAMEEKSHRESNSGRDNGGLAQEGLPFRQCRWGVGYGPRDCSDYATGVSIIPIDRLTEADKRWMLTAPYGGSGGKGIMAGLVVEEPDIEIGAGVSSKAISRRVGGEKGSSGSHKKGGKFDRKGKSDDDDSGRGGWGNGTKERDAYHSRGNGSRDMANPNNMPVAERRPGAQGGGGQGGGHHGVGGQPEVEGLPFGLSFGANGEIQYPPGFRFPDPSGR